MNKKQIEYSDLQDKDVLTVAEVAVYLRLSKKTVDLLKGKVIPVAEVGGRYLFLKETIKKWLDAISRTDHGQEREEATKRAEEIWDKSKKD